jgi:Alanine dehydrogenase/PNT, N-terminal domain
MLIGVPREIKSDEYRVGLTPASIEQLAARGHRVMVETTAGVGAGIADQEYIAAGAEISANAEQMFRRAELIIKVKEPLASERKQLRRGQIIFTYLHQTHGCAQSPTGRSGGLRSSLPPNHGTVDCHDPRRPRRGNLLGDFSRAAIARAGHRAAG